MISQLGHVLVGVIDSLMVGRLGEVPLAASSLANSVFFFFMCFGIGVSFGLTPLVSQFDTPDNHKKTTSLLKSSLIINTIIGLIICGIVFIMSTQLKLLKQEMLVEKEAEPYLLIISLSIIPFMIFQTLRQFSEGLSFTKESMIVILGANVVNVVFNYLLIFGAFGFPKLGLVGAGWATLISRVLMTIWMVLLIKHHKKIQEYVKNFWSIATSFEDIKKLLNIGIPSGLQFSFEVSAFVVTAIMMGWLGATIQAAHQIALSLASISYMMASGLATTATIRVGNQLGKKDYKTLKEAVYSIFILVVMFEVFWTIVFIVGRKFLPSLYIDDYKVLKTASNLMIMAAFFQLSDGLQVVGLSALRGLSDTKIPTWITFVAYWVIGLPIGYFLGIEMGFEGEGIWVGLIIGLTIAALSLFFRFNLLSNKLIKNHCI